MGQNNQPAQLPRPTGPNRAPLTGPNGAPMAHLGFSPPTTGFPQSKSLEARQEAGSGARLLTSGRQGGARAEDNQGRRRWETGGRGGGCSATGSQAGARLAARLRIRAAAGTRGPGLRGRRGVPAWPRPPGGRALRTPEQGQRADGPAVRRSRSRGGSAFGMTRCGTQRRGRPGMELKLSDLKSPIPCYHM